MNTARNRYRYVSVSLAISLLVSGIGSYTESSPATNDESSAQEAQQAARLAKITKPAKAPPTSGAWTKIYDQRNIDFYIDPALIVQNGNYVTIPYLVDLPEKNDLSLLLEGRLSYSSVVSIVNYDCSRRSLPPRSERYWQSAENYFYPGQRASGNPMINPFRRAESEWIAAFDGPGLVYVGRSAQVSQAFFVNRVLVPELKICQNLWKAPPGFQPQKIPPYIQIRTPPCNARNPTGGMLESCSGTIDKKANDVFKSENLVFAKQGTYTGKLSNGFPTGYGRYQIETGDSAGDLYIGFFRLGNFDGFGTYYHQANDRLKGSIFIGYFKRHKKNGPGVYLFADGSLPQEGIWEDDILVKPKKTVFIDTLQGLPLCQGDDATTWTDCFGYLEFEAIEGQRLQGARDQVYAGGFKDGLPGGVGTFFSKDGHVDYQGQLRSAKPDGVGTEFFDYAGERYYTGGFSDGKRHGKGVALTGGGSTMMERYEGEYVNGVRSGLGTLWVEKSFKYVGGFKANKFDGYGVYTPERVPGGEVVVKEGIWKDGRLLKPGEAPQTSGELKPPKNNK